MQTFKASNLTFAYNYFSLFNGSKFYVAAKRSYGHFYSSSNNSRFHLVNDVVVIVDCK